MQHLAFKAAVFLLSCLRKVRKTYNSFSQAFLQLLHTVNPEKFVMDSEKSVVIALSLTFSAGKIASLKKPLPSVSFLLTQGRL